MLGPALARVQGLLSPDTRDAVQFQVAALLAAHGCVLLDVTDLRVEPAAALDAFPAALDEAGDWPAARLVLVTDDPGMCQALRTTGCARRLRIAPDVGQARRSCTVRPDHVSARWTLPPTRTAPSQLRRQLHDRFQEWDLPTEAAEEMLLMINELASNVVDHAGTVGHVQVDLDGAALRAAVRDDSPRPPRLLPRDVLAARGRGLQMIDALAERWGWERHGSGKTVWVTLRTDARGATPGSGRSGAGGG